MEKIIKKSRKGDSEWFNYQKALGRRYRKIEKPVAAAEEKVEVEKKESLAEGFKKVERNSVHCPGKMAKCRMLISYGGEYGWIEYFIDLEQFKRCRKELKDDYAQQCGGAVSLEEKVGCSWVEVERIEYK